MAGPRIERIDEFTRGAHRMARDPHRGTAPWTQPAWASGQLAACVSSLTPAARPNSDLRRLKFPHPLAPGGGRTPPQRPIWHFYVYMDTSASGHRFPRNFHVTLDASLRESSAPGQYCSFVYFSGALNDVRRPQLGGWWRAR
eukprot:scaffold279743_cov32-Tisochrysis_lutea.AAC.5